MEIQKVIDSLTSDDDGIVMYREATLTIDNGEVVQRKFHRGSLTPGQPLAGVPQEVADYAKELWTPDVIAAFKAKKFI